MDVRWKRVVMDMHWNILSLLYIEVVFNGGTYSVSDREHRSRSFKMNFNFFTLSPLKKNFFLVCRFTTIAKYSKYAWRLIAAETAILAAKKQL